MRQKRPQLVVSEGMLERDNFFHSCWMELKNQRKDLWDIMTQVEIQICGFPVEPKEKVDEPSVEIL